MLCALWENERYGSPLQHPLVWRERPPRNRQKALHANRSRWKQLNSLHAAIATCPTWTCCSVPANECVCVHFFCLKIVPQLYHHLIVHRFFFTYESLARPVAFATTVAYPRARPVLLIATQTNNGLSSFIITQSAPAASRAASHKTHKTSRSNSSIFERCPNMGRVSLRVSDVFVMCHKRPHIRTRVCVSN